jgi:predicted dehydrogenase
MPRPNTTSGQNTPSSTSKENSSRRHFLKTGSAATAAVATTLTTRRAVRGDEPVDVSKDYVRIGLVGAGGRGGGAINDTLTINDKIRVIAIADLEEQKPAALRKGIERYEEKVAIDDSKLHTGIDSYKRILDDKEIDLVLFATPPGFRPQYVAEAVDAGKHVFAEKPTCVDPAGYKTCLWAHAKAEANGTSIVTGTQYRRQENYVEAINRIHGGEIGDIISSQMRYCSKGIWYKNRKEGMSDTQYQLYNWMHFIWLSGDQIAEQAVHNLDTMNWVMGGPPESAFGSGGRFTRPDDSEMWDNVEVDFQYPGNRMCSFMCRQIPGAAAQTTNVIYGSDGICHIHGGNKGASITDREGNEKWSMKGDIGAAYKQEHKDLVDSILNNQPIVELKQTADSSLTGVMGRMAAYTGQKVDWEFVTEKSELSLFPKDFDINGDIQSPGFAVPGKTKLT